VTPFMHAVRDVLDGRAAAAPATEPSRPAPVPAAADAQVKIRSLAEQLVGEANAVLVGTGRVVALDDEVGPGALAFTLRFSGRSAVVRTVMAGGWAETRLLAGRETEPGAGGEPRRLAGEDELPALLLTLIGAGTSAGAGNQGAGHAV
jgi:hypothetical protein